jgi:hypothetical protein
MKMKKRCMNRVAVSIGSHMLSRRRASIRADIERSDSNGERMVGFIVGGGHGIRVGEEKMDEERVFWRGERYSVSPPAKGISHKWRGRRAKRDDGTRVAKKRAEGAGTAGKRD